MDFQYVVSKDPYEEREDLEDSHQDLEQQKRQLVSLRRLKATACIMLVIVAVMAFRLHKQHLHRPHQAQSRTTFLPGVTVALSSSNRYNLLEKTLRSFFAMNSYPLHGFIIVEDGPYRSSIQPLMDLYPNITWLFTGVRKGQLKAIDMAYSLVETEWIFHSEDDWLFHKPGFIEYSIDYMNRNPNVINIHLRQYAFEQMYDHQTLIMNDEMNFGISFTPTLKRMSDYLKLNGGYSGATGHHSDARGARKYEAVLVQYYRRRLGMKAATVPGQGYIEHQGGNDSVEQRTERARVKAQQIERAKQAKANQASGQN